MPSVRDEIATASPETSETIAELKAALAELASADLRLRQKSEHLEKALMQARAEQTRYQELFDFAPEAYVVTDCHGLIREANYAFASLVDRRREFVLGKPLPLFAAPAWRAALYKLLARKGRDRPGEQPEMVFESAGAGEKVVNLTMAPIIEEESSQTTPRQKEYGLIGFRWLLRDVTLIRQTKQAYLEEKAFADNLVDMVPAIILVTDIHGRIRRSSPYLHMICGSGPEKFLFQAWDALFVPANERPLGRKLLRKALQSGKVEHMVFEFECRPGLRRTFNWSATVLPATGDSLQLVLLGIDITELRTAQERALQAERLAAIGQMVTGLAHESRNALQRSSACLEIIRLTSADRPEVLDMVGRVQRAQDDLHRLLEEVRGYAAPIQMSLGVHHLPRIWRDAWSDLESLRQGRQTELREEIAGLDLYCLVSPFHLRQVFRNLLENALAAARDPVVVTIRGTEIGPGTVQIAIRDNGPGLPPEERERIFEPFFTTKIRGTGLGLPICRRILEAHGGRISLSPDTSAGAEFILTLPRDKNRDLNPLPPASGAR
jgi:PAS domain S-box-containing protein